MWAKKLLFGFVGLSNLAVLSLVFGVYFQNHYQTSKMYSTGDEQIGNQESEIKDKIKKQCGKELENVIAGKRSEFICSISMKGHEKGSSYILRTKVTVKKRSNGFMIEGLGSMSGKTRYATEADFCNTCEEKHEVTSSDQDTIFAQVFDIAKTIDHKAASSVINAQEAYREKDLKKRRALLKQKRCKGEWDENSEEFIEYDSEEVLNCKISKLDKKDTFQKETYYNDILKKELWKLALSDDYDLLNQSTLRNLQRNHFRQNLSVQNSTNILSRYLDWKSEYEDTGVMDNHIENKLVQMMRQVDQLSQIDGNLNVDYQYLKNNHLSVASQVSPQPVHSGASVPATIPSNPTSLKNQVLDLY